MTKRLYTESSGRDSDVRFANSGMIAGGNSSHLIFLAWRPYCGPVCILVDIGMTGDYSDTLRAANLEPFYVCGDADFRGAVGVDDVVYLIAHLFSGGNAPCDADGDRVPDC